MYCIVHYRCIVCSYFSPTLSYFLSWSPFSDLIVSVFYRFFFEFLLLHARSIAAEIHDEYVETMSKVYSSYFQSYTKQLWKLQVGGITVTSLTTNSKTSHGIFFSSHKTGLMSQIQLLHRALLAFRNTT